MQPPTTWLYPSEPTLPLLVALPISRGQSTWLVSGPLLVSRRLSPREMLASVDWHLLVLFGGLFVVTGAIGATSLSAQAVSLLQAGGLSFEDPLLLAGLSLVGSNKIGRASCRESVCQYV